MRVACGNALERRLRLDDADSASCRSDRRGRSLLGTLAVLSALELQALYALLVPLGAHAPGTAHRSHRTPTAQMKRHINSC
jgi:hypothetical protein